jgi:hypothetical protein
MTDQYGTPRAFRQALETRLMTRSKATGVDLGRLRRQVAFERLLARLAEGHDGTPSWVLKGGFALELRLGNVSRSTRDLDLATFDGEVDGQRVWTHLSAALEEDAAGDNFIFAVAAPRPLAADMAGRPGWRFSVDVRLAGKSFALVRMDVVARAEEITDAIEPLTFSSALAFAGLAPSVTVPAIDVAQHAAEKFHALTRNYGDRPNTRVKDLVDLVLLTELDLIDPARLTDRVRTVFRVRATHPMPTELPEPPSAWRDDYLGLIEELDIGARTIEDAMAVVRPVWRICVGNAGDPSEGLRTRPPD